MLIMLSFSYWYLKVSCNVVCTVLCCVFFGHFFRSLFLFVLYAFLCLLNLHNGITTDVIPRFMVQYYTSVVVRVEKSHEESGGPAL